MISTQVGAGCVPAILSPALLPPFAGVLRWRDFAVLLRPADIGNLPAVLAGHDHARLHANLLKVRRLLSFVATGPVADDDALPLIVFEMWRRSRRRRTFAPGTATALAAPAAVSAGSIATPTEPLKVAFACEADGTSCAYAVRGARWNCSRRTKMACGCSRE